MEVGITVVIAVAGTGIGVGGGYVLRHMMLTRGGDARQDAAARRLQHAEEVLAATRSRCVAVRSNDTESDRVLHLVHRHLR